MILNEKSLNIKNAMKNYKIKCFLLNFSKFIKLKKNVFFNRSFYKLADYVQYIFKCFAII